MSAFSLTWMYFSIGLHIYNNKLVFACLVKTATWVKCLCSTLGFFVYNHLRLPAWAVTNSKIWRLKLRRRRHTSNTSSYSISSRSKQLFNFFCRCRNTRKKLQNFIFCKNYNNSLLWIVGIRSTDAGQLHHVEAALEIFLQSGCCTNVKTHT